MPSDTEWLLNSYTESDSMLDVPNDMYFRGRPITCCGRLRDGQ